MSYPDGCRTGDGSLNTFLSIAEAAARKKVHYQTVRRAIARGVLPAKRVGRAVIIAAEDLERWQPHYERAPKLYKRRQKTENGR